MECTTQNNALGFVCGNGVFFTSAENIIPSNQATNTEARSLTQGVARSAAPAKKSSRNFLVIPHFRQFLGFLIAADINEVRSVLIADAEDNLLHVYIVVSSFDFDVNERIYDREELIMEVFCDLDFDFQIITQSHISDSDLEVAFSK